VLLERGEIMANKKGFFDSDIRQLTDVFRELQETRLQYEAQNKKRVNKTSSSSVNISTNSNIHRHTKAKYSSRKKTINISITLIILLIAFVMALFWSTSISAKDSSIELY